MPFYIWSRYPTPWIEELAMTADAAPPSVRHVLVQAIEAGTEAEARKRLDQIAVEREGT